MNQHYLVIKNKDIFSLQKKVDEHLKQGCSLIGGLLIEKKFFCKVYYQSVLFQEGKPT